MQLKEVTAEKRVQAKANVRADRSQESPLSYRVHHLGFEPSVWWLGYGNAVFPTLSPWDVYGKRTIKFYKVRRVFRHFLYLPFLPVPVPRKEIRAPHAHQTIG